MSRSRSEYSIRPAVPDDAAELFRNMRQGDRDELTATGAHSEKHLRYCIDISRNCWVCEADGQMIAVFGVSTIAALGSIGCPWMLGTCLLDSHQRAIVIFGPAFIGKMRRMFRVLENYVDTRNTRSVRWLRRLGFTIHDPKPFGLNGEMFHHFTMEH